MLSCPEKKIIPKQTMKSLLLVSDAIFVSHYLRPSISSQQREDSTSGHD